MVIKSYKKFDKYSGKRYMEAYIKKFSNFYSAIKKSMKSYLIKKDDLIGLDIGAGPGIGALLLDQANIKCILYGLEPSKTHGEGKRFANELKGKKSSVIYEPRKGVIQDLEEKLKIGKESLDFVLILRAIHELRESVGGKLKLKSELKRVTRLLKKGGILIVADPQYNEKINKNPLKYREIIDAVKILQKEIIGHSHEPGNYIPSKELKHYFPEYKELKEYKIDNKNFNSKKF